jgi:hypothetical protein
VEAELVTRFEQGPEHHPRFAIFLRDDLFTPPDRPRGLPLGNQTSQFFANVYLTNWISSFFARCARPRIAAMSTILRSSAPMRICCPRRDAQSNRN